MRIRLETEKLSDSSKFYNVVIYNYSLDGVLSDGKVGVSCGDREQADRFIEAFKLMVNNCTTDEVLELDPIAT